MNFNQFRKRSSKLIMIAAAVGTLLAAYSSTAFAQFTFTGDFDRSSFGSPLGYFVEGQNNFPQDTTNPARRTYLFTGELNPDGSMIAGGRIERGSGGDFWLRKFTATGAPDTSFGGGNGYVRTVFSTEFNGIEGDSLPTVLKRQADGKIIFGGVCNVMRDQINSTANTNFGVDWCLVRYNVDGSLDSSFGNNIVQWSNGPSITYSQFVGSGRVATQTSTRDNGLLGGTGLSAQLSDIAIQPDGKIVAVGYTRSETNPYFQGVGTFRMEGILVRYNVNGSIDTTFGANGIARFLPMNSGTAAAPCFAENRFSAIRLQPDGRIVAVGNIGVSSVTGGSCSGGGTFFVVTRWTANGQLETTRRLDGNTNASARENAVATLITNDGGKLLVSGTYQGNESLVRLNLSDLTVDTSFGTIGVVTYLTGNNPMYIKAIQTDGKILGFDNATNYPVFRLNPNGSPDNSFGNIGFNNSSPRGRADLPVFTVNTTAQISVGHMLLRPNGKFNVIGSGTANLSGNSPRALVSQNLGSPYNGDNADFDGDGKTDLSIFRPGSGEWWYLKSSNGANVALHFGAGTDKITPGDFTGDGKTDFGVFRPSTGFWFVLRSEDFSFYSFPFGTTNDVPTPGDFDGDGKADAAIFRPSNLTWYINRSSGGTTITTFGTAGDVPVATDYDGDGLTDIAIYRPSLGQWWIQRSSTGVTYALTFGNSTDKAVAGDYTGDGKSDVAIYRPSSGSWFILRSEDNSFYSFPFGTSTDIPSPGDYDGDGKFDAAIFRPSTSTWYSNRSTAGVLIQAFGTAGDIPVPNAYIR